MKTCIAESCRHRGEPQPADQFREERAICRDCERANRRKAYWRSQAPCQRCQIHTRAPWSQLCQRCRDGYQDHVCQIGGCTMPIAEAEARWCDAHTPGSSGWRAAAEGHRDKLLTPGAGLGG